MWLCPDSTQTQEGWPVVLMCCEALFWVALAAVLHCLALGGTSPPVVETPITYRVPSPADVTGGTGAVRLWFKKRCLSALAGSHSFPCPTEESRDHSPSSGEWALAVETPLVGFSMWGSCSCLPWATSGHGRQKIRSGRHQCNFLTLVCLSITLGLPLAAPLPFLEHVLLETKSGVTEYLDNSWAFSCT